MPKSQLHLRLNLPEPETRRLCARAALDAGMILTSSETSEPLTASQPMNLFAMTWPFSAEFKIHAQGPTCSIIFLLGEVGGWGPIQKRHCQKQFVALHGAILDAAPPGTLNPLDGEATLTMSAPTLDGPTAATLPAKKSANTPQGKMRSHYQYILAALIGAGWSISHFSKHAFLSWLGFIIFTCIAFSYVLAMKHSKKWSVGVAVTIVICSLIVSFVGWGGRDGSAAIKPGEMFYEFFSNANSISAEQAYSYGFRDFNVEDKRLRAITKKYGVSTKMSFGVAFLNNKDDFYRGFKNMAKKQKTNGKCVEAYLAGYTAAASEQSGR